MSYDNTNRGTLGKNKKLKNDKSPPYTGLINIEGVEYWVSGWVKKNGQTGESFFSLSLTKKDQSQESRSDPRNQQPDPDFNDSIPF